MAKRLAAGILYALFIGLLRPCLHIFGYARTKRLLQRLSPSTRDPGLARHNARTVAYAVRTLPVYRLVPATCLHKSLFLWWFLHWFRLPSEVVTGVSRDPGIGRISFHAWVESDGVPINDTADVGDRFKKLDFMN